MRKKNQYEFLHQGNKITPCRDENKAKEENKNDRIVDACEPELNKQKNEKANKSKMNERKLLKLRGNEILHVLHSIGSKSMRDQKTIT